MPCYHPLPVWYGNDRHEKSGKVKLSFSKPAAGVNERRELEVPCGTCIGCRLEYARNWATRCLHESKLWPENSFLTLTYDDAHLPNKASLVPKHLQLFLKRLRKKYGQPVRYKVRVNGEELTRVKYLRPIRFFGCGEYGEHTARPHYHCVVFNWDPPDRVFCKKSESGDSLYTSDAVDELWGYGNCWVGAASYKSAGYVARYALKKVYDPKKAGEHYNGREPEFLRMSRRPGVGHGWATRFMSDWYRDDCVVVDGIKRKPPRYYDSLYEKAEPGVFAGIKRKRFEEAAESSDNSGARLIVREAVKEAAVSFLKREDN